MITRFRSRLVPAAVGFSSMASGALFLLACGGASDAGSGPGMGGASNPQGGGISSSGGSQGQPGGASATAGAHPGGSTGSGGAGNTASGGGSSAGSSNQGGNASGGSASGGTSSGGSASGGSASGGRSSGGSTSGGTSSGGSVGTGGSPPGQVFSQSRFHFGTIDSVAAQKGFEALIPQLDFFTSGWLQGGTFDHGSVCTETNPGATFANQVPVLVSYIAAARVKSLDKTRCDCNVTTSPCVVTNDLCHTGAAAIMQNLTAIIAAYTSYSAGFAKCYGTTRPIVFEMEPDFYQYTQPNEGAGKWTPAQAATIMSQFVAAMRSSLPNARFSMDISPWIANNGSAWYPNFDMTQFTFINTSGGGTNANTAVIRSANQMTWAGVSQVTGKPILADTGYGANGSAAGEDPLWNVAANINARMADGVVSISQYNPTSSWGATIAGIRGQLNTPKFSP